MRWIDHHCHIPYEGVTEAVIAEAVDAGVERLITVGTTLEQSTAAAEVASRHDNVWATAGVHPHDATDGIDGIEELLGQPRVVAVGECGLDYHYDHSPRDVQKQIFIEQIRIAQNLDLPLVIHTREAWDDTFEILDAEGMCSATIFHCFTGGPDEAIKCLDRGALLSFSGVVTFKTAQENRDAAALCPLDRLLVETDSPYLAPVPKRGKRNVPANVVHVGQCIADVKGVSLGEVADATWATTCAAYRLPDIASPTSGDPRA